MLSPACEYETGLNAMGADQRSNPQVPREGHASIGKARLYYRELGRGRPMMVLHGGPDFDHRYLLPEMDRLSEAYRLIYYDQRGRGQSADGVRREDVTLASEIEDLDALRQYFRLETVAVAGHSWGGLLAMVYAIQYPGRVSHLILMNTAPATHDDFLRYREERRRQAAGDLARKDALASGARFRECDPDAVAEYYRVHFRKALRRPEHLDRVIERLRASFTREGILLGRAIEDRLMIETALSPGFDLLPELAKLRIPALILHGEHDLIPVECVLPIAQSIPGARFVALPECGHFAYLERPEEIRRELAEFLRST